MGSDSNTLLKRNKMFLSFLTLMLISSTTSNKSHFCSKQTSATPTISKSHQSSLIKDLTLEGNISFKNIAHAAKDFGNRFHFPPLAVLNPKSVSDISSTIKRIFEMGSSSEITVAAKGHGHSLEGQAQAHGGVIVNMESLRVPGMTFNGGDDQFPSYVDISGGVSGQAFKHGPQINNVYQLEVVTGKGEVVTCSEEQNSDLFHAVLGGLGQFGIITRARIALEPAPKLVKWIRMLYSDFATFTNDQEYLITSQNSFDYIEGFVIINRTGLLNKWRSSFNPKDPVLSKQLKSEGRVLYCLEVAKYFNPEDTDEIDKKIDALLSELDYVRSTLFLSEVSYVEFLDRVHVSEIKLREKGLWEVPHPWLNLLIPRSKIYEFAAEVFGNILTDTSNGPILIYPVNKSKWRNGTSMVTPEEDVFYLVSFLSSAMPHSTGRDGLEHILTQNQRILNFCKTANLGVKQYLPHYKTQEEWKVHFGDKWEVFSRRKFTYDPLAILAPGHRIFKKVAAYQ